MAGAQTRGRRGGQADVTDTKPSTREAAEDRRRRRDRDAPLEAAYKAGYNGDDPAPHRLSDDTAQQYDDGAAARKAEDRRERVDQVTGQAKAKGMSVASDGAGFLLGIFAYALFSSYLAGGAKGTRAWLSAKFLNKVSADAPQPKAPAKPATPSPADRRVGA